MEQVKNTPRDPSPYGLIQEELRDEPWRMLIACIMLNLTNIKQVRPIITEFFERYPDAESAASAEPLEMAEVIRTLGLYNRRVKNIIEFSYAWAFGGHEIDSTTIEKLPGIGRYAGDSYKIFVEGSLGVEPTDRKLKKYVLWATEGVVEDE